MIVGEQELTGPYLEEFRKKLDAAVLQRIKDVAYLEPYSEAWDLAYHEASKPVWAIRDEAREHLWLKYLEQWGKNATGAYFLPQHTLTREERISVHRVTQKLAQDDEELVK